MLELDAVMAALHGLIGEALEGRGRALLVAGEAGLGKTTVLEHAVAAAQGRFKVGVGRADVAEAAYRLASSAKPWRVCWAAPHSRPIRPGAARLPLRRITFTLSWAACG